MRTCRTCAYARYNPLIGEYRCTLTNLVMTEVDEFDCESYRKGRPCGPSPPPRAAITTNDHTRLRNRNAADQHSIGSIHGLQDALPTEGLTAGDVYNCEDTDMNYGWNGEAWAPMGTPFSIEYVTNEEIDTILAS